MINILIADDHQLMITGIKSSLQETEDIHVVAEAGNGYQVLEHLESGTKVDVILMDINMPMMDGVVCTKKVSKQYPDIRIIAISQYDEKRFVKLMVKNGAAGYILKDAGIDVLKQSIREVHAGRKYFCERLSSRLLAQELKEENVSDLFPKLTGRETEVLNLICQEFNSQEISEKLFISYHTVESHRANLIQKAGVKNTAGLVRWAIENDYIY
ncbi:response regulator [Bacteroidota bacterium]